MPFLGSLASGGFGQVRGITYKQQINIVHYNRYMKNYATLITSAQYVLYSYDLCIVKTGVVNA